MQSDDQEDMNFDRLLEIAAAIEQFTVKKPELVRLALISLHNIKEVLIKHNENSMIQQIPQIQINLETEPMPINVPGDAEFNSNFQFMNDPPRTELCFDELDSMQLAQVQNIPFLFHNNDMT